MRVSPYLLLCLTALFWGGNWVIARGLQDSMSPVAMSFWRWLIALFILLPFVARSMIAERRAIASSWKIMAVLGVLGVCGFTILCYTGLKYTMASNALLLNSVTPVLIIAVSFVFFGERAQPRQLAGVLISLAGMLVIVARGELQTLLDLSVNRGDVWVLSAVAAWAVYTVCLRWRPADLSSLAFTGSVIAIGVFAIAPLFAWDYAQGSRTQWNAATAGAVIYFSVFPSVLAYFFWNRSVREVGANRAGFFMHLVPVFGIALSVVFLHESLAAFHAVGAALIFTGIYLASKRLPLREWEKVVEDSAG
ncbi:MAG TPA: DMT family transporter [Burkholderiales bacterium]|nr:DMT family transporter [Burkholderiales bacterium]